MPEIPPGSSPGPPIKTPSAETRPEPAAVVREFIERTPGVTTPQPDPRAVRAPVRGPVKVLFLDVDGTLTDGVIVEGHDGDARHFWVRDGLSLLWARDGGLLPVAISGRKSRAVERRMKDLGIECHEGIADKVAVAEKIVAREQARWDQCAMLGDDLPDVPLLKRVGWPMAVANARPEVRALVRTVTAAPGGRGAVREAVELLLRHNGTWEKVLEKYEAK